MLDLPGHPVLDKHSIIGGCVRLAIRADPERLRAEVDALESDVWGSTAGRVGVHRAAQALFLRGYAPAEGNKPIDDRPIIEQLPYIASIFRSLIPAQPLRVLLARLPAGATIPPHMDLAPYISKSLRIHVPIETNTRVWMISAGQAYRMAPGEVWALNNSAEHAVWNGHETLSRTHLICDFLPSTELIELIAQGERELGISIAEADAELATERACG